MNSLDDDEGVLRSGGGAFMASLKILRVPLMTSVARMAFSFGESCSETSLLLPWFVMFVCLTRDFVAAAVALGLRAATVFDGGFDIVDGSQDSSVLGLVRRRSFNNFGIAGGMSPVETAFLMASAIGDSISVLMCK